MKQPPPEVLLDLDQLPIHFRIAAQTLGAGLDFLQARHEGSWNAGRTVGRNEAAGVVTASETGTVRLMLSHPEQQHLKPAIDEAVLGSGRLSISSEQVTSMRLDCERHLGGELEPTNDQWKAILSVTPSTLVTGGAGTGKSRVLILRALFLHRYVGVPLTQMQILTFSREARMDMVAELRGVFAQFGIDLTKESCLTLVKTPQSCMLEQVRALPDLAHVVPFEVYGWEPVDSTILADGRQFEPALFSKQRLEMVNCLDSLYRSNKRFSEIYISLWASSLKLPTLDVDEEEVVKRAAMGWRLSEVDDEVCDAVESLWRGASAWPIEGVTAQRKSFTLRGRAYSTHGYVPQLRMHIVLGFDRTEQASQKREENAQIELYKEVAIKRTLFQAYFPEGVIHLDSYQDAYELAEGLRNIAKAAPQFSYALSGSNAKAPLLESFNSTAGLLDSMGLEVASITSMLNFLPGDSDALYVEVLGMYWPALLRHVASLSTPVVPYGRLFSMLAGDDAIAMRHLPGKTLGQCRHLLVDGAEDQTAPVATWLRAVLGEIRRRDHSKLKGGTSCSTVTIAGDVNQWVYGSYGSSPRLITGLEEVFPCAVSPTKVVLAESFRSIQPIIEAGYNLVQGLGMGWARPTQSLVKKDHDFERLRLIGDEPEELTAICEAAEAQGHTVLILIESDSDKEWVGAAVGARIRSDRAQGRRTIRVREFRKAKALEADVVVMVGDPSAGESSWYKNQLFKLAGFSIGGDPVPADTVNRGEALRLSHAALLRARFHCYWFPNSRRNGSRVCATSLAGLNPRLFDDQR